LVAGAGGSGADWRAGWGGRREEGWCAQVSGAGGLGVPVDLGEFVFSPGEADFEAFGFAGPAFAFGFGDAGGQVVGDLCEPVALGRVGPVDRAPDAGVFVDAGGA